MPTNSEAVPIEMAVARSAGAKYRAATLVMLFSTSGCPQAITSCPPSCQPNEVGATRRISAPAPVRSAPTPSAWANLMSSQRPVGNASTM